MSAADAAQQVAGDHPRPAAFIVTHPSGNRSRVPITPLPFLIGRQAGNHLVLRDNRASRMHARIVAEGGKYVVEDLNSRHGTYVNGERVTRQALRSSDRIDFGLPDSYRLMFTLDDDEIHRVLEQISSSSPDTATGNLAKLRALLEVARALQTSLSTNEVLTAVVDAALAVTGSARGFLLLRRDGELEMTVARDRSGRQLDGSELQVPTKLINRALNYRRDLLTMSFDPLEEGGVRPEMSVAALELRSVVCVPLIRIRAGNVEETLMSSAANDTVGLLYMDSRDVAADLSAGNRELLQTLALEASTVLENARLLEEERVKQRIEEELKIAQDIQKGLLPPSLPTSGWFRAAGSSIPSTQVGGDYFDIRQVGPSTWATVVADVSGKGMSSALLASLLQGAFLMSSDSPAQIEEMLARINRFLSERTRGEKYATIFYCAIDASGLMRWANAGHCAPYLLGTDGRLKTLQTTGMPVGMLDLATFQVETTQLQPGDKIVIYSDGLTEAENADGEFFDSQRLRDVVRTHSGADCFRLHAAMIQAVEAFSGGGNASDDITAVVLEYMPGQ